MTFAMGDRVVVRQTVPGARWWRLDIHAHSPSSKDYGGVEGNDSDGDKPSFLQWVKAYIDAGIDGVVITDHNTHEGIEQARGALANLREEDPTSGDLVLFPGVELTVAGGVHLLGIFDPTTSAETVNHLIARCNYDGIRGGSTQTANATVADAAHEIEKLGGICVPAHADKNAGVFTRSELDLPTIKSTNIVAAEILDDAEVGTAERQGWVALLGSDAHFLTIEGSPAGVEAKAPGTHFTCIKAERLDLEGLRLALTDAKESVQRARADSADPNTTTHGHIDQITVSHRGSAQTFRFNPWMNCLIGGRGVGKSTIIELIRLAMGRSGDLEDTALTADLQRFIPGGDPAQRWWEDSSAIEVHYTRDSQLLRVLWSGSDAAGCRIEAWNGVAWEAQAGSASDRAPIQVFSQKQIYELAREPQSFLAILDRMEEVRKAEWNEQYAAMETQFRRAREDLRALLTDTGRADRLRGQLQEVQGRLRHLEQLRADPRYRELETSESNLRVTTLAEQQAQAAVERLRQEATDLRSLAESNREVPGYEGRSASLIDAAIAIDELATKLDASAADWHQADVRTRWSTRIDELGAWLAEQGGQAQSLSAEQTRTDRQLEKRLQEELLEFENTDQKLEAHRRKLEELLAQLADKRKELHQRRSDYVNWLSSGSDVPTRVRVFHQGGIASVGDDLRVVLNRPESFDSIFDRDGIPKPLFDAQPKSPTFHRKAVPKFKNELQDLIKRGPDSDIAGRVRIDARFHRRANDNDRFDLETNVLLWFPEDLVTVEYKPDGSSNFTPVDKGSPGQKTAALLTIILQMGNEPLLLDQPEDDLENKLIKHLAVETLKHIKRRRQLIISTHNANIVVTSAAEQVLVIQHGEDLPALEASGTLQTEAVKDNVCLILEGGEDAIKTRYRRLVRQLT